jgi:hypothetical protein
MGGGSVGEGEGSGTGSRGKKREGRAKSFSGPQKALRQPYANSDFVN